MKYRVRKINACDASSIRMASDLMIDQILLLDETVLKMEDKLSVKTADKLFKAIALLMYETKAIHEEVCYLRENGRLMDS